MKEGRTSVSVDYKDVLCYGIELTHERELAYINEVGEERWEEIYDEFFILVDGMRDSQQGIIGIEITSVEDGEYVDLGDGHSLIRSISSELYDRFREAMFEVGEFKARPQLWMICQVS